MNHNENISVFDEQAEEYDSWFTRHSDLFAMEKSTIEKCIPEDQKGIEIGVGTGRFAEALGIKFGVEPSEKMSKIAEKRGVKVFRGFAENLPIEDNSFDFAIMVTTVCFLKDIPKAFSEVNRILKPNGEFIVAIIEKKSELGKKYTEQKSTNVFYQNAHFHSTEEITNYLIDTGFENFSYWQIGLTKGEKPTKGCEKGDFVVIHSRTGKIIL